MDKSEQYSQSQLRKIRHLKIAFSVLGALALIAITHLLLPLALAVLVLAAFALLVLIFLSGTSSLLDRIAEPLSRNRKEAESR